MCIRDSYSAPHYAVAYGPVRTGDTFTQRELGAAGWYAVRNGGRARSVTAVVPFRYVAFATGLPPLWWAAVRLRSHLRRRRQDGAGHCRRCGYDLRATPDRCPEC